MQLGSLTWDESGKHFYYTGIDGVALFVWDNTKDPQDQTGVNARGWFGAPVAWNGVTAVNESPSGAESNKQYADNIEYLNLISKEEFSATIECFQVPSAFNPCDGIIIKNHVKVHGQPRKSFGLIYRVQKGSDTVKAGGKVSGDSYGSGYIYHIIYGCKAAPSSRDNATVNESPEAQSLSYELSTSPVTLDGALGETITNAGIHEITHIEIDGTKLDTTKEGNLKNLLYGVTHPARMATPSEIVAVVGNNG